ncbi:unnamed protein product [Lactuca virosa]|uniref:Uncharacterized protein n=1 Tax=Lactuca virosa TaxID=75947 RepID=A0AAU9NWQ5_9ASTR|nr:unnamed protein product [Lactuca virosa]
MNTMVRVGRGFLKWILSRTVWNDWCSSLKVVGEEKSNFLFCIALMCQTLISQELQLNSVSERWPSRRITPRITSRTRLTGTVSRSQGSTDTLPPKEWIPSS